MSVAESAEQQGVQQTTEKTDKPSYKDILDELKQRQLAERESKEQGLHKKPTASYEEYMVKHVLERIPSGDVKITPSKESSIIYTIPQENVLAYDRPTISFPDLSDKPLSITELVSAFKASGQWLDGSQVITLKRCAQDIQDAIIVEVQDGKKGNWEYLYNKAVELEAIAQEQINGRLPMQVEKTDSLPQTGVTLEELRTKKIVPHMVRERSEQLRKSLEDMPSYQRAGIEARDEARQFAENMEKELGSATPENFISQILQQEAQFLSGDQVSFETSDVNRVIVSVDAAGKVSVALPANMDMTHVAQLAGEFSRVFPGQTASDTRIAQFANQLEDTALLMEQRGGFSPQALEAVYNTGRQLQSLLTPDNTELSAPITAEEIHDKALDRTFTEAEKQKIITEMLLGRGAITTGSNGELQQSAFDRLYTRWEQSHPGENQDTFIREYLEPREYRLDFLRPYIEASVQADGRAHAAMHEVAGQRAHESIAQTQIDSWIEAVRGASGVHNTEFTQTIHETLAQARMESEQLNKERAANGESLLTVEEAKIRDIEAITKLLQSPEIADQLTYAPADIRALFTLSEPPSGEEALWGAACNIKAAYAKAAFEKLGFEVGVKRGGTHRYLLITVGVPGEERVLSVDVTTPQKVEVNGEFMAVNGVNEILDEADRQNALIDIAKKDSNQILISSIYHNIAIQMRNNGGNSRVVISLLQEAIKLDPESDATAYAIYVETGDATMLQRALSLNPRIQEDWKKTEGLIGSWTDFYSELAAIPVPTVATPPPGGTHSAIERFRLGIIDLQKRYHSFKEIQDSVLEKALSDVGGAHYDDPTAFTLEEENIIEELRLEYQKRQTKTEAFHKRMTVEQLKIESEINSFSSARTQFEAKRSSLTKAEQQAEEARLQGLERDLVFKVNAQLDTAPDLSGQGFPDFLLRWSEQFRETRERVVNTILFNPYKDNAELNTYRITFYAEPRLKDMINAFKTHGDMDKHNYYVSMQNAVEVSHGMNKLVNVGEIGALSKVAQEMNKEHFALMGQVPGQGAVMEIYEKEYTRLIARDQRITPLGYDEIKKNVQAKLRKMNEAGVVRSQFENERDQTVVKDPTTGEITSAPWLYQDWEVQRAYSAGRAMYNMFLRSSMHISFGQIQEGVAYGTSYPQGRIVESLNPWDTLFERWGMGSSWGGTEFVSQDTEEWFKAMNEYHFIQGINKISTLGNKSVESIQKAAQLKFVDFLSGMRINNIAFPVIHISLPENTQHIRNIAIQPDNFSGSLKDYFDQYKKSYVDSTGQRQYGIDDLQEIASGAKKNATINSTEARELLNSRLQTLVENTDLGFGALLMHSSFLNTGEACNSGDTYDSRRAIWEKVARTNLPLMTDYLTGLQFAEKDENGVVQKYKEDDPAGLYKKGDVIVNETIKIKSLEEILYEKWFHEPNYSLKNFKDQWKMLQEPDDPNDPPETIARKEKMKKWFELSTKMETDRFIFEQKAMLKNKDSKVSKALKNNPNAIATPGLDIMGAEMRKNRISHNSYTYQNSEFSNTVYSDDERLIIQSIQKNGQDLAEHLADVYWNNVPFLDIPMEEVDYKQLGSDEYRRKVAGDHSQLYTAFNSLIAIAKKPASQDAKSFTENMKAIIDNIEDVDGGLVAQQNTFPITKIVMEWKMIDKGSRFFMYHNIKNAMNQPNSQAQRLQGIHAEALDEFGTNDEIDDLMKAGVITPQFAKKLKKELGTSLWNLIWSIMRDAGHMMPYIIAEPFIGEALKME